MIFSAYQDLRTIIAEGPEKLVKGQELSNDAQENSTTTHSEQVDA
jgi:uncharacterized protein (DUF362 family)